jgi:hypothetical protein
VISSVELTITLSSSDFIDSPAVQLDRFGLRSGKLHTLFAVSFSSLAMRLVTSVSPPRFADLTHAE